MNTTNDRISEEAHGNIGNFLAEPIFYDDFGFDLQCGDPLDTISISGTCDFSLPGRFLFFYVCSPTKLFSPTHIGSTYTCSAVEPSEFINAYLGPQLLSPSKKNLFKTRFLLSFIWYFRLASSIESDNKRALISNSPIHLAGKVSNKPTK